MTEITDEMVSDVLITALDANYGGSNYWVEMIQRFGTTVDFFDSLNVEGIEIYIWADADEDPHVLTRDRFVEGILREAKRAGYDIDEDLAGNMDADNADNALQFALFGEVIYG